MKTKRVAVGQTGASALGLVLALSGCGGGGGSAVGDAGSSAASKYTVGGSAAGLSGSLTLQNAGSDSVTVSADGPFVFPTALATGTAYSVTVATPPAGETCTVTGGSGTVGSANVANVAVNCAAAATAPSADLVALAAAVVAIQVAAALPVTAAVAAGTAPCATGSVAITASPPSAQLAACASAFDPGDAFSGQVASAIAGVPPSRLSGLSQVNSGLLGATVTLPSISLFDTAGVAGNTLSETLTAQSLTFSIGQSSNYQLNTFALGSPMTATRTLSGGGVSVLVPSVSGQVALGAQTYTLTLTSTLGWTDSGAPTSGSLQIHDGTSLLVQATFESDGSVQIVDALTGFNGTRRWTDADLAAALAQVTR